MAQKSEVNEDLYPASESEMEKRIEEMEKPDIIFKHYNYYRRILTKVVHEDLSSLYANNKNYQLATLGLSNHLLNNNPGDLCDGFGGNHYFQYTSVLLDSLNSSELKAYYTLLKSTNNSSPTLQFVVNQVFKNEDFFHDLIGTKLIAEEQFAEAIQYLEQVSMDFVNSQNIAPYLRVSDYRAEQWTDGKFTKNVSLPEYMSQNPKIVFCQEMLRLTSAYNMANDKARPEIAYQLADAYRQTIHRRWYLTQYYQDGNISPNPLYERKIDFYLNEALKTKDNSFKAKVLMRKGNYEEILSFSKLHPKVMQEHISKCDMLKEFMKTRI